ncbi:hypothetical protein QBC38DRAFT_176573 [Podospora fimiseda]|uniref:RGS domain-containing protein n=1 Tax=Podospora fimiseda TaxID=252190 RepID=A0AAN7H8A4_9PEZI|nr:hypothetical protein QBC38DRAFT_176573 [Podospora fimiseda]
MKTKLPSWLVWYKKPEWRDIRQYSAEVSREGRTLSPDGRNNAIPSRLALDRILGNKTCSPMSLYDFYMYLKYIEHSAENLEFYLWFKNYEAAYAKGDVLVDDLRNYGAIPSANQSTSSVTPMQRVQKHIPLPDDKEEEDNGNDSDRDVELAPPGKNHLARISQIIMADTLCPAGSNACVLNPEKTLNTASCTSSNPDNDMKFMSGPPTDGPITRHELDAVINLFLIPSAEKELNIPPSLRQKVLEELRTSSHPSVLEPVADHAYYLLRNCSHRNFVRLGVGNGTFETLCVATLLGFVNLVCGYVVVLCRAFVPFRGSHTRWEAFAAWPFWWLGLTLMVSGLRGSCFFLLLFSKRQPLPWERFDDNTDSKLNSNNKGFLKVVSRLMIFDRRLRVKERYLRRLQRQIVLQSLFAGTVFASVWTVVFLLLPVWKETV